ncbi:MAG: phosphatidylglycerol lysyltransferase domain-containing protein [Candidatus Eiseniibacteriota bacterium]
MSPQTPVRAVAGARELERVLTLLKTHGWNSTSFQVLEPGFRYWFDGDDGCVAYVDTGRAWVVGGAPIAHQERFVDVMRSFQAAAVTAGRRVCCFGTESRFHETVGWPSIRIGDQPVWSPADWTETLSRSKSLREQLRRARAKGSTVRRLDAAELAASHPTRSELDTLIARWLATRPMATMGFLVQVHPYTFPEERRCFVAELDGRIVGFLGVVPVYARGGWFFEDFLGTPDAPNGTIETLIDAGMRGAAAEGATYVTLGLAPLVGEVAVWLRMFRRWGGGLYDFAGLRAFKAKFKPRVWDPISLSYPPGGAAWTAILDTLSAFSQGGLLAFGVRTLIRGPAIVMRVLALLLVPWIAVLSLPSSAAWFPSEAWRWGWVVFDVAIGASLFYLSQRWHPRLADALAGAITLDAVVTLIQAVAFDIPRHHAPFDWLVILVAVLAPMIAATLLWAGRAHRRVRA